MFGNKRAPILPGFSDQIETIIGKDTQIKGTISAGGTVRIDGQVDGEISTKGDIIVGETGVIKAQIQARSATIAGSVHGNADVMDKLELTSTAKLYGDIKTGILIIGEGAVFKGACEMRHGKEPGSKSNDGNHPHEMKVNPAKS
ncbi:MAG: polymer-forming cytoskeletal protein [Negativicutes bacterium]|nr:polymer-forming cytoskeletal protein [Negativicutes bacterium]